MKNVIDFLVRKSVKHGDEVKPTVDHGYSFEKNCRNKRIYDRLIKNLKIINEYQGNIGKYSHKRGNTFHYSFNELPTAIDTFMYPIEPEPVVFTQELFDMFVIDCLNYQVKYLIEEFLTARIDNASTNTLSNLMHLWYLESNQELVSIYKEALDLSKKQSIAKPTKK